MNAKLVFLGKLADLAGAAEREVAPGPLADVLAALPVQLAVALLDERVRLALNGELIAHPEGAVLQPGDELAFLPPVSGG
ncbi:MAG: MoaD/ThiS family protein [Novosphingobium sp.]|uniref:MoaD/ThiS family protein n=1 Tax=Novosphingobium sp. TaxID=1874826 RepID=UPI003C7CA80A